MIIFIQNNYFIDIISMGAQSCQPCQSSKNEDSPYRAYCCDQICYASASDNEKNKELKPIQFSDLGSDRTQQHVQQNNNAPTIGNPPASEQYSTNSHFRESSPNDNKISKGEMVVVSKFGTGKDIEVEGDDHYEPMTVPFSVIKLAMNEKLWSQIQMIDKQFEKKHASLSGDNFRTWKLQSKGFYTNLIQDGTTIMISENEFYEGWTKQNTFIPENGGVLVTERGVYKGNFKNGMAHGRGKFIEANNKKKCDGIWFEGCLQKGEIQSEEYKYQGYLNKNMPNGRGTLQIKKTGTKYVGNFQKGKFEDKQAKYECDLYIYVGGFKNGMRSGIGVLYEKQMPNSNKKKNKKYIAPRKIQGVWENDEIYENA